MDTISKHTSLTLSTTCADAFNNTLTGIAAAATTALPDSAGTAPRRRTPHGHCVGGLLAGIEAGDEHGQGAAARVAAQE